MTEADGVTPMTTSVPENPAAPPRPVVAPFGAPLAGASAPGVAGTKANVKVSARNLTIKYGERVAVKDVSIDVAELSVMAFIGPSGCGKSTILRCFDRMNDLVPGATVEGAIELDGVNLLSKDVRVVELRRRVGMVFQRPNPFPMSIYENVAYGPRRHGMKKKAQLDEVVEKSIRQAALWDEVKDDLRKKSGLALSGGQQQRLCIARTLATGPEVILMDEPCSALDPIATLRIEELIRELQTEYTILIVTHNMQQAARVSDRTAFFTLGTDRAGYLVEEGETSQIFTNPRNQLTEDYVSGRFG
jgi:phosphate transport system ATP-binding protein